MPFRTFVPRRGFNRAVLLAGLIGFASLTPTANAQFATGPNCPVNPTTPSPDEVAKLRQQAKDRGFLWKIEKDGKTSYLYGTIHLAKLDWAFPGPNVINAIRTTKQVALELDLQSPEVAAAIQKSQAADRFKYPSDIEKSIFDMAPQLCLELSVLQRLSGKTQALLSTLAVARQEGLYADFGIDMVLNGMARAMRLPIRSLESYEMQDQIFTEMLTSTQAIERMRKLITDGLSAKEMANQRQTIRKLADLWARGDLKALETYFDWCECARDEFERSSMRRLNDDRNGPLAEKIAALHNNEPVFAAIGSLHFSGPQAVHKLLEKKGFKVTFLSPSSV